MTKLIKFKKKTINIILSFYFTRHKINFVSCILFLYSCMEHFYWWNIISGIKKIKDVVNWKALIERRKINYVYQWTSFNNYNEKKKWIANDLNNTV